MELERLAISVSLSFAAPFPFGLNFLVSLAWSAGATVTRPSIEANDSCKLADAMLSGFAASRIISANARLVSPSDSRLSSGAAILSRSMTHARTIALEQPAMNVNSTISGAPINAARRLPASMATDEYKNDRCIPDTEITCADPVADRVLSSS